MTTAQDARWTALRDYLTESEKQCEGAAAIAGRVDSPGSDTAVRFRAEALGYRRALEKMTELEPPR